MVKKLIEEKLKNINCTVILFEPLEQKIEKSITKEIPKMTAGRAALIGLMDRYLQGLMDPFISLIEVHKLMYFMQESGEELRLKYKKAQFGPYADNLRHVLNTIEGHFISGYEDGGDAPTKQLKLIPKAVEDAKNYLTNKKNTNENFVKVAKLVDGFETPFGLELLSIVHWIVKNENASNLEEVISKIYNWNERKKQFSEKQIKIALDVLIKNNWIN